MKDPFGLLRKTRYFITVFTRSCHWTPQQIRWIQPTFLHHI